MTDIILNNLYLILLLPLWIFLIIMVGRFFSVYVNKAIIYSLTLFSSAFGAVLSLVALLKLQPNTILEVGIPFITINNFRITCGLHVDRLALIFASVLFIVSFLVQLFSISYMKNEKKNYRFFALLNLFNFAMAGLFFSPNLFQTYFFWELVGVSSYFLIGFEYFKNEKSIASKKVFIINRIGDTALITAIIFCSYFIYSYAGNYNLTTLSFVDMNIISTLVYAYTSTPLFLIICGLFIVGCMVKSAQFPFFTWLQDAMQAKLPVSALLHSATMVATGVFLMLRLTSFFALEAHIFKAISLIGLATALVCSLSACAQNNPKKVLAYSTSAQLGLMFFAIGTLNIKAAIAFFIAHAFIKTTLFLTLPKENESWNIPNFVMFLFAGLSLSGLIFSGMVTKEMIANNIGTTALTIFAIISFLTAFYITRIALVLLKKNGFEPTKPHLLELITNIGFIILNIVFYLYIKKHAVYSISAPFWTSLTGWAFVYILFAKNAFCKIPILYQLSINGFYLDKFYTKVICKIYDGISIISNFIDKNIFSNYKPIISISKLGVKSAYFIENNVFNNSVNIISNTTNKLSIFDKKIQKGNVQYYNAYAFLIITIILTCLILVYTAIMSFIGG